MSTNLKISAALVAAFVVTVAVLLGVNNSGADDTGTAEAGGAPVVREDSHQLSTAADDRVTLVEFLDFECEACLALFPVVEQLREDYAGEVTFVARYFPLPGHFNSERAARTVESAARQGKFEEMYVKMYETQTDWSEQQKPMDDLFRSYAEELGLDMEQFDADYSSDEVAARVQKDIDDGTSLDVQGTPTLYVNGELLQPESEQDLVDAIDAALAK